MNMKLTGAVSALALVFAGGTAAQADSISSVENARAKDRAGYHVSRQDREKLRRYGRNDDGYGYYRGYRDDYGPSYGGATVYIGPGGFAADYDD